MLLDRLTPRRRVIALDSCDCFAIESAQLEAKSFRSKSALSYELEQYLPLDAERMVIDIIAGPRGIRTQRNLGLVVVADRGALEAAISDMEETGDWIAGISARFLLVSQYWCQKNGLRDGHLLWQADNQDCWDYLKLNAGRPIKWRWLDSKAAIELVLNDAESGSVHVVGNLPDDFAKQLEQASISAVVHKASDIDDWTAKAKRLWLRGSWKPWSDFRGSVKTRYRSAPMYASLLVLTASILILLASCAGYVFWKNGQLSDAISNGDAERTSTFERLFPRQSVPTDIPGRLTSELRKLESSKQELSKEPPIYSSFPIVIHFLKNLPEEATFRIDAIRAKSQQLSSVEGSAKSLTDFQSIVGSLRTGGFEFAEPSVTQMKDGFSLRLERLTYRAKESDKTKPPVTEDNQP